MENGKWEMAKCSGFFHFPFTICHSGCVFQHPARPIPESSTIPTRGFGGFDSCFELFDDPIRDRGFDSRFEDATIQRFDDSTIRRFEDSRIQGFKDEGFEMRD
jgi:hypothetical protein